MISKKYIKSAGKYLWGFYIRVRSGGEMKRLRIYEFATRKEAEEAVAVIRRREREERYGLAPAVSRPRLADLVERRIERIERPSERVRSARILRLLVEVLRPGIRVDEITTADLSRYIHRRQADGVGAATIDRELNTVAATLHAAPAIYSELAQWRAPKIPRPKVAQSRRDRILTDEEYRALLAWLRRPAGPEDAKRRQNQRNAAAARHRVAAILEFAMLTGMRAGEIYALQWADIDWTGERIRVRATKTDSLRYVPLSTPARSLLEAARALNDSPRYVWTRGGHVTPKIYRIFREACEACGITYGNQSPEGLVLYCTRHTFATRLLQAGADLKTVGELLGHSDGYMTLHYSHVTPASRDRARALIEAMDAERRKPGAGKRDY